MSTSPKVFAEYIRDYRKKKGLPQTEIGELVGLRQVTISAFEDRPTGTKADTLFRILSALELELQISSREELSHQNSGGEEEWWYLRRFPN